MDFTVCQEGETLSSEQARILKLLGHQQAAFRLNIVSGWNKAEGDFKLFKEIEMREGKTGNLGSGGEAEDSDENFEEEEDDE